MLQPLDYITIVAYLVLTVGIGIKVGGKSSTITDYFKTSGDVPWWAVSFSIVATETSMLTVISIPAVAYLGSLQFLQVALGYIIGRVVLSFTLLPSYFTGEQQTAYTFLEARFGQTFKRVISALFLVTRLLADGVRLFAAAIPIKIVTGLDYPISIAIIAGLTLAYTYYGGLRSVIWIDVIQFGIYALGGALIIGFIASTLSAPVLPEAAELGKLSVIDWPDSLSELFFTPYNLVGAVIGGLFLTMASHGTDHLLVQRLLACRDLAAGRKALISSGLFVFLQFLLFLLVGVYLYQFYEGAPIADLLLDRSDELVPKYVMEELPPGIAGLIIAGLFAAAMSTLSSSLSALSSSTLFDLIPRLSQKEGAMRYSRYLMVFWSLIFFLFAVSFTSTDNPVIELGLGIAGFTYGGLLGAFFMARYSTIGTRDAIIGLVVCVGMMIGVITQTPVAWPWYTSVGVAGYALAALASNKIFG